MGTPVDPAEGGGGTERRAPAAGREEAGRMGTDVPTSRGRDVGTAPGAAGGRAARRPEPARRGEAASEAAETPDGAGGAPGGGEAAAAAFEAPERVGGDDRATDGEAAASAAPEAAEGDGGPTAGAGPAFEAVEPAGSGDREAAADAPEPAGGDDRATDGEAAASAAPEAADGDGGPTAGAGPAFEAVEPAGSGDREAAADAPEPAGGDDRATDGEGAASAALEPAPGADDRENRASEVPPPAEGGGALVGDTGATAVEPADGDAAAGGAAAAPVALGDGGAGGEPPHVLLPQAGGGGGDAQPPAPPGGGGGEGSGGGRRRRQIFEDRPMSIVEHLDELRRRLFWMIGALLAGVAIGFAFVSKILAIIEQPLHGLTLHIIAPLDVVFAFVKIAVVFGLIVASPVIIYQLVAYVLPALSAKERRILYAYLPPAVGLFLAGMAFGYFVFVPLVLTAVLRFAGHSIVPIFTIDRYVSFLLSFTLPFGVVFELPVIVITLVKVGVLSPQTLAAGRRWAIMVTVIVAAIFAPPDPITPLVMAAPIYALYEVSIWVARLAARGRNDAD